MYRSSRQHNNLARSHACPPPCAKVPVFRTGGQTYESDRVKILILARSFPPRFAVPDPQHMCAIRANSEAAYKFFIMSNAAIEKSDLLIRKCNTNNSLLSI